MRSGRKKTSGNLNQAARASYRLRKKDRDGEFPFGLQQAREISARSDSEFSVQRKGRNAVYTLDLDGLSRELVSLR